jgi:uncharacterized protein (TIGR03546 family)
MFIQWIAKIFVAFNSNTKPIHVSLGVAMGLLLALIPATLPLTPPLNLLWFVLFFITFFLKINQAVETVFMAIFKCLAWLAYPLTSLLGELILTRPELQGFYTWLASVPVMYFTGWSHTLVAGGLVAGIVLFIPVTLLFNLLLRVYRDKWREKIANSKLVRGFQQLPLVKQVGGMLKSAVDFYQGIR